MSNPNLFSGITITGSDGGSSGPIAGEDLTLADSTTNNSSTTKHGFLPKLSGNAYDWFKGDGTYSQTMARGTITTSSPWSLTQTWNSSGVTFDALNLTITNTAAAEGSKYLSIDNGSGNVFRVEKETTNSGGTQHAAIVLNAWDTAGSQDTYISTAAGGLIYFTNNNRVSLKNLHMNGFNVHQLTSDSSPKIRALYTTGLCLVSGLPLSWSSSSTTTEATADTGLNRDSAGVLAVTSGTAATYRGLKAQYTQSVAVTFANRPGTPVEGMLVAFTDSTTATWGATITGTGSNHVLGYYNGTNWTVAAA